jgi:toxin-antitoxin system PIN domain toxin
MRCVDVNVLVYAHRGDVDRHEEYRTWLDGARAGHEPLGVSGVVLSGFLRVVTHPKVFREPTPSGVALEFANAVRESPAAIAVEPGRRHWSIFQDLCRETEARGNDVADAYLAALAIEHGGTWYSADRSFARYPSLRWRHPLDT